VHCSPTSPLFVRSGRLIYASAATAFLHVGPRRIGGGRPYRPHLDHARSLAGDSTPQKLFVAIRGVQYRASFCVCLRLGADGLSVAGEGFTVENYRTRIQDSISAHGPSGLGGPTVLGVQARVTSPTSASHRSHVLVDEWSGTAAALFPIAACAANMDTVSLLPTSKTVAPQPLSRL